MSLGDAEQLLEKIIKEKILLLIALKDIIELYPGKSRYTIAGKSRYTIVYHDDIMVSPWQLRQTCKKHQVNVYLRFSVDTEAFDS